MYFEAIIVCVNYADFLKLSLPYNLKHFDNIVVVTSKDDSNTQKVCSEYGIGYTITNRLYENGDNFNKGKAINDGVLSLKRKGWVLITDADMMMPLNLRQVLVARALNPDHIYGTSRLICPSYTEWQQYLKDESTHLRWKHQKRRINIGVGFFQLVSSYNSSLKNRTNWYSERYGHCARSDRIFWRSFSPENRKKLKGVVPIHLGDYKMGLNWNGRKTPKWT